MQATKGDNAGERPMWAEKGGLDFEGRAKWDAWTACKGLKAPKARLDFVRVRLSTGPAMCLSSDLHPLFAHHHKSIFCHCSHMRLQAALCLLLCSAAAKVQYVLVNCILTE